MMVMCLYAWYNRPEEVAAQVAAKRKINMPGRDRYCSFVDLQANTQSGVDYRIIIQERSSLLAVLAPHGGGIEPGTSEIARALAGERFSLYLFEGLRPEDGHALHITSTRFDEPGCLDLLMRIDTALTVHGCLGDVPLVYVGGRNLGMRYKILVALQGAGFQAEDDNSHHPGNDPRNLCNLGRSGQGIQLELTDGLRRLMFAGLHRKGRQQVTPTFTALIQALQDALNYNQDISDQQAALSCDSDQQPV